jgi:carbon-monoxide dehydrogenase medium subunit
VALTALGAEVKLVSSAGERTVSVDDFVTGHRETIRKPDELLQEVIIPLEDHETRWGWHKLGQRKAYVCSIVSVAIVLQMDATVCKKARIALGSMGPKPFLSRGGMQILEGRPLNALIIEEAARTAADETSPTDDHRATAWYRKRVSKVMIRRVLEKISGQEGGGDADS